MSIYSGKVSHAQCHKLSNEMFKKYFPLRIPQLKAHNPVMVFIHGGAFSQGSSKLHPPNYLLESDIVLVVPQYRLGPLGFLSTQSDAIVGNAGLLDIELALNWIKKYISNFGGDPGRITVFGQSSGAAMISALLFSPMVPDDLVYRVIMQSGSYFGPTSVDLNPVANAKGVAMAGGCNATETIDMINDCLTGMDLKRLFRAYNEYAVSLRHIVESVILRGFFQTMFPSGRAKLSINEFLPLTPNEVKKGHLPLKNIPILMGINKNEGSFFLASMLDG